MYRNYVFDLYGTLVDIHTDENNEMVWEKLSLFYGYYGASYQPKELKDSYMRLVREAERDCGNTELISGSSKGHEGNPEIQIETVFEKLFTGKRRTAHGWACASYRAVFPCACYRIYPPL